MIAVGILHAAQDVVSQLSYEDALLVGRNLLDSLRRNVDTGDWEPLRHTHLLDDAATIHLQ